MKNNFPVDKDPAATLDYGFDWTDWLSGDVLVASSWSVFGTSLVIENDEFTNTVSTVWLSGGINRSKYKVVNRITTAGGRIDERTLLVSVDNK